MLEKKAKYLSNIQEGYQAFVLKKCLRQNKKHCHVVPTDVHLAFLKEVLSLVAPDVNVLTLPEWDTVPYDRVSPKSDIEGERIEALCSLANQENKDVPLLVLTTPAGLIQKVPQQAFFKERLLELKEGQEIDFDVLKLFLQKNSYKSVNTVINTGEYAIRGGLVDIFPAGFDHPVRIDFFGNEVDEIKFFDEMTQRTLKKTNLILLKPMAEFALTKESIALFRTKYRTLFENVQSDFLYESVSNGVFVEGLEHYLPLFHQELTSIFEYLRGFDFSFDFQTQKAFQSKLEQIDEYYEARLEALKMPLTFQERAYNPIPKEEMFLTKEEVEEALLKSRFSLFSPFMVPNAEDLKSKRGKTFVDVRLKDPAHVFDEVAEFVKKAQKNVIFTASSFGSAQRLSGLLRDKGIHLYEAENFKDALKKAPSILVAPFENGFEAKDFLLLTETDILGERIIRKPKKQKQANFITDISALNVGDLVVHQKHGVGRFEGLKALNVNNVVHDCLELLYEGGDKLFIPVENLETLSKYGSEGVALDHLGSQSFITRKNKVKKDLLVMAEKLIATASLRELDSQEKILAPHGAYQEFCARFPYVETEDQTRTIQEIEADLASGKPMDRLVCGDVGFGKTEVALRAAFLCAMAGKQVALIVPTTLLALQHFNTFQERFKGFPIRVGTLSRLVTGQKAKQVHKELETGVLDIVIGTHALLSKGQKFKNLGLVIVDEEQHFGVTHKERLKELKKGVHVLTLTATPIPRTLQLSLSGVRSLSVIATPPVDRLAVKTFVTPFDGVIIKEAILREYFRGGQVFYVCPRISDMPEIYQTLSKLLPEIKIVKAHGQMPAKELEKIMSDFAAHKYDVLLATSIVESGLDIKAVNTIIIHKADMFGLAALYQMRGRVGRGKLRAYAYLVTSAFKKLSAMAEKRLTVMQNLDSLGAGFTLASHDLDIRGAGNLLGDEQSGHIKEVGIALYQKMLYEAIQNLKENKKEVMEEDFSPQISMGFPVIIPQNYVAELDLRMELYHRASLIEDLDEIDSFSAEIMDRFGAYPVEVENLFATLKLKVLAKKANIERLDVGPKGAVISFYQNIFPNPAGLIQYIQSQMGTIQIKPDQKLVVMRPWGEAKARLEGVHKMLVKLAEIAGQKES
ncbi:MAG: transcription-repair coupling factor [Alphaproteobacteria bacterium]|nr:transcription-repair coupling factor [Alphaproteobacteria bacterium]